MLNFNHPIRMIRDNRLRLTFIGIHPSREHKQDVAFILATNRTNGEAHVIYRKPDGNTVNGYASEPVVNVDTTKVASLYQTMDAAIAGAVRTLWKFEQLDPAIDVMVGLDSELNPEDVRYYFEALWG